MRQFLRAIHRDLLCTVRQRRIFEALDKRILVRGDIDPCRQLERRCNFIGHQPAHQRDKDRLCGNLVNELVTGEETEIRERRVARIEQPQFHRLERSDVRDQFRAHALPRRPTCGKVILDCPLLEWLVYDGSGIVQAQRGIVVGDIAIGSRRHDPVHHRRRKGNVLRDPTG